MKESSPLIKGFLIFLVLAIGLAVSTAPKPIPVDYREVSFKTSSDSRIYFHNVRSYYYDIDRLSKRPMEIYRLKRIGEERASESLNFDIIRAAAIDEAFIFARVGTAYEQCDSLTVKFEKYPEAEDLTLINSERNFQIAAKVYTSILESRPVYLCCGSDTLKQLYVDKASQLDAEIALEDYFRLTLKN